LIHSFFLFILGDLLKQKVITLSEGQKGLLSMCSLILQKPSILILDEPTNHINFRHLKSLANAIKKFEGAVLLVSHDEEFVRNVDVTDTIDLGYQIK
jgi:ATPase subunit of ABC transporter with duplicated ATPase domains